MTWERGRIYAWQKLAGVKFSPQGRIMLQRRALSKFWLWSKYRGNLMYMIFLILLWLNFSITGHWNIPQQSTPATAVLGLQCNEAKQALCTLINSFFNPHKEKKAHCSCLNISRSLIHKCQLSHLKAVDFNSCLNSRQYIYTLSQFHIHWLRDYGQRWHYIYTPISFLLTADCGPR